MNHCFQSLTGSFFPSLSPFLFAVSFSFFPSRPFFPLCASPSFLLAVLSSLCQALSHISRAKIWGDVFMIVHIFHGVVLSAFFFPAQPVPRWTRPGDFVQLKADSDVDVDYFFFCDGGGPSDSPDACVCMHARETERRRRLGVFCTCMYVRACAWVTVTDCWAQR